MSFFFFFPCSSVLYCVANLLRKPSYSESFPTPPKPSRQELMLNPNFALVKPLITTEYNHKKTALRKPLNFEALKFRVILHPHSILDSLNTFHLPPWIMHPKWSDTWREHFLRSAPRLTGAHTFGSIAENNPKYFKKHCRFTRKGHFI